jgi:hypothetical protein
MSQRKTLSKVPLTPQFATNGLSYADVVKFDNNNNNLYFVNHDAPKEQTMRIKNIQLVTIDCIDWREQKTISREIIKKKKSNNDIFNKFVTVFGVWMSFIMCMSESKSQVLLYI